MRGHVVIDITADPLAMRRERRRAIRRIGVPLLAVALTIVVILVISFQASRANRRGALVLSDDVLASLGAHVTEQVTDHFGIPARQLAIGETLAALEQAGPQRRTLIENFFIGVLGQVPQIADLVFADADGNFMMVRRNESGGMDTKLIQNVPAPRRVIWVRRDAAGNELGQDEDPADTFDPRTRPWYAPALTTQGTYWTDVYTHFTTARPGITASTRYQTPEGRVFVVAVDVELDELSHFLASLRIGETGRAMIVTGEGRIIAYPNTARALISNGSEMVSARIDQIGDAPAAGAFDHFRVSGPGRATVTVADKRYLATLTPLTKIGRDWSVMIVLPEDDLIGFVARNNRTGLLLSLAIVAIAVLLAGLLVRQGLRGDRAARLARIRTGTMTRQNAALDRLAEEGDLFEPDRDRPPEALTETIAELTRARRISLWFLSPDGSLLRCADSFHLDAAFHTAGLEIRRGELPEFFRHLAEGVEIDAADAAGDPRTAELHRLLLAPVGSRSLTIVPIRRHGRAVGGIWLEDPADLDESRHFLRVIASMTAPRVDATSDRAQERQLETSAAREPEETRDRSVDLTRRRADPSIDAQAIYPDVSVMVMRLGDPGAAISDTKDPTLLDAVVRAVQELAAEQDIRE